MIYYILLIVAFTWALVCSYFDQAITARGVKSGVAVEGNGLIVRLVGNKPTFTELMEIETPIRTVIFWVGLVLCFHDSTQIYSGLAVGALVAYGFKNLGGYRAWKKLGVK